jgi:hypothetical protein
MTEEKETKGDFKEIAGFNPRVARRGDVSKNATPRKPAAMDAEAAPPPQSETKRATKPDADVAKTLDMDEAADDAPVKTAAAAAAAPEAKQKRFVRTAATALWTIDRDIADARTAKNRNAELLLLFVRRMAGTEGYKDINMVWHRPAASRRAAEYKQLDTLAGLAANWEMHMQPSAAGDVRQALAKIGAKNSTMPALLRDETAHDHLVGLVTCMYVNQRAGRQSHAGTRAGTAYVIQKESDHVQWLVNWMRS